jgi:hypothetical protein
VKALILEMYAVEELRSGDSWDELRIEMLLSGTKCNDCRIQRPACDVNLDEI